MILERKITDLPEKHSVIQIHTGRVFFYYQIWWFHFQAIVIWKSSVVMCLHFPSVNACLQNKIFFHSETPKYKSYEEVSIDWNFPQTEFEKLSCRVFTDLWEQGYFLTSGGKFGGSFLVYPGLFSNTMHTRGKSWEYIFYFHNIFSVLSHWKRNIFSKIYFTFREKNIFDFQPTIFPGDPARFHSFYIAVIVPGDAQLDSQEIAAMSRLGTSVKKTVLVCSEDEHRKLTYISLQWAGITWTYSL